MTDAEITRVIAEKIIGGFGHTPCGDYPELTTYYTNDGEPFYPLLDDADCMAAWDRFSEDKWTTLGAYREKGKRVWEACVIGLKSQDCEIVVEVPDRRRAMCECMVKSVMWKEPR